MLFDYVTYKLTWWCLMGALLIGFALTNGFDFGIGMALPFLGADDRERRLIINAIGPTWEGNQTWLLAGGGCLFAAWPLVSTAAFSGFQLVLMLCLFTLFFRAVGFDHRARIAHPSWRNAWDWCLCLGGLLPPLIFGIAFGNLLQGLPFQFDDVMRFEYSGSFAGLLNPFGLLAGALCVSMMAMHGAAYVHRKTGDAIARRARKAAIAAAALTAVLFAIAGCWVAHGIDGYRITTMPAAGSAFVPIEKTVIRASGAWMDNYARWPLTLAFPTLSFAGTLLLMLLSARRQASAAFVASGVAVAAIILTAGAAMFPFVMPSSLEPASSLTAWDAVASHHSLAVMFWMALILLPVVASYTRWVYRVMRSHSPKE